MYGPIHFYLTFNPFLNNQDEPEYSQAHEFYDFFQQLLKKDENATACWGKIIGSKRQSRLKVEDFQTVVSKNSEEGYSTHLYITDFQNIWVAKVVEVHSDAPKTAEYLPFYLDKNVEIWFELGDYFLLEHTPEETANKLSELYIDNDLVDLEIDGLSPFTTGIKYPTFVQDLADEQYFDQMDETHYKKMIFHPNAAVNNTASGKVSRMLQIYCFSEKLFKALPHAARLEIEAAEIDMLEHKHHNFHSIAFSYIKTLEVILNELVIHQIKKMGMGEEFFVDISSSPPKLYFSQSKDQMVTLKKFQKNFSIGTILYFVDRCNNQGNRPFKKVFSEKKQFVRYLLGDFRETIDSYNLIGIRGTLAHNNTSDISVHDAQVIRNLVLGLGETGLINRLYQTFDPVNFKGHLKYQGEYQKPSQTKKAKLKLVG